MKQDKIDVLLNELKTSGASAWEITDRSETGWEFYLIGSMLDQHRVRDVNHVRLKVYSEGSEGKMGSAEGELSPMADRKEMAETIASLLSASRYAQNPQWTLTPPAKAPESVPTACPEVDKVSADYLNAVAHMPRDESADINSSEIFVTKVTRRILNSEGLDVTDTYPVSMAEIIVNARNQAHEIELYRMFRSGSCDATGLQARLYKAMRYGQDKLVAKPTPAVGAMDLVLSTEAALEVYRWYISHLNTAFKYRGYSDWELGVPITEEPGGDRLTLHTRVSLPNSSRNCRFDDEGAWTRDMTLMKDNVPQAFCGPRQFAQYLGISDSFIPGNYAVDGGSAGSAALLQGDYLEVVEFSSFQIDEVSGDMAGEIRLGYLHQDGQVMIVSGGSVSGNMSDFIGSIRFSRETRQYDNYLIPAVTRLKNVSVAGGPDT